MLTKKYVFTKEEQDQYVSGKRGALQRLQHKAGKAMFVHCGLCLTAILTTQGVITSSLAADPPIAGRSEGLPYEGLLHLPAKIAISLATRYL